MATSNEVSTDAGLKHLVKVVLARKDDSPTAKALESNQLHTVDEFFHFDPGDLTPGKLQYKENETSTTLSPPLKIFCYELFELQGWITALFGDVPNDGEIFALTQQDFRDFRNALRCKAAVAAKLSHRQRTSLGWSLWVCSCWTKKLIAHCVAKRSRFQ